MIDNNPRPGVAATLAIDWQTVSHALGLAAQFVSDFGPQEISDDARARLAIIVEEIVANVVEHGDCPPGSELVLMIAKDGDRIEVSVEDGGTAFDPRSHVSEATMPPPRGGGAGLALVTHWAKTIDYSRVDGRNRLKLILSCHG